MSQPQSQHCCPVKSVPPSHFRPGVASRGIGKGGKLGQCAGRLWGSHEQMRSQGRHTLTILPGPLPEALPPPPLPRLALGVLPQLLLMTCNWRSALSARSRSSSMNCCRRSLALASRAAVSFRNWSICTTSLGREQPLTPGPWPDCPQASRWRKVASGEDSQHSGLRGLLMIPWIKPTPAHNTNRPMSHTVQDTSANTVNLTESRII